MWRLGWRVFRIPAAHTLHGTLTAADVDPFDRVATDAAIRKWMTGSADGIVHAIMSLFYRSASLTSFADGWGLPPEFGPLYRDLVYSTLEGHRLAEFPLADDPTSPNRWLWRFQPTPTTEDSQ
jgi:hypothetical protein